MRTEQVFYFDHMLNALGDMSHDEIAGSILDVYEQGVQRRGREVAPGEMQQLAQAVMNRASPPVPPSP